MSQDGRTFAARLVQPARSATDAYPVVAFGHGFTRATSRDRSVLAGLAAHGDVVIAPETRDVP